MGGVLGDVANIGVKRTCGPGKLFGVVMNTTFIDVKRAFLPAR